MIKDYLFPSSVEESLELLKKYEGRARLIAGGTDLIVDMRREKPTFEILLDIERIDKLREIKEEECSIFMGAGVTFTELEESAVVNRHAEALALAASQVGGPQIRNQGTIGGNVVSAQPAADGALALFALNAQLEVASWEGTRAIPIQEAYQGLGKSLIDSTREILVGIRVDRLQGEAGSNYQRVAVRRALQLPVLGCGVFVKIRGGIIEMARLSIGPVANRPFRAYRAERFLKGKGLTEEIFQTAGKMVAQDVRPRESRLRGSSVYRKELAAVLIKRGLNAAGAASGKKKG